MVEAALRDINNGTVTGNDHINIATLTAGEDTIKDSIASQSEAIESLIPSRRHLLSCTLKAYQKEGYPQNGRMLRW